MTCCCGAGAAVAVFACVARCVGPLCAVPQLPAGPGAAGDGCTRRTGDCGLESAVAQPVAVSCPTCQHWPMLWLHLRYGGCLVKSSSRGCADSIALCAVVCWVSRQAAAGALSPEAQEAAAAAAYAEPAGPASPVQQPAVQPVWRQQQAQPAVSAQPLSVVSNPPASRAAGLSISLPPEDYVSGLL